MEKSNTPKNFQKLLTFSYYCAILLVNKSEGRIAMADILNSEASKLLIEALLSLKTQEECKAFLEDALTTKEILDIGQRMVVAKLLSAQTVYNKIAEETGASTATISRVNRSFLYGKGGYQTVLERIKK